MIKLSEMWNCLREQSGWLAEADKHGEHLVCSCMPFLPVKTAKKSLA